MSVTLKATVMDADQIRRSLSRIAHEIIERNRGVGDVVLVGIVSKGDVLAERLASTLTKLEHTRVPFGRPHVTPHPDDPETRPATHPPPTTNNPRAQRKA